RSRSTLCVEAELLARLRRRRWPLHVRNLSRHRRLIREQATELDRGQARGVAARLLDPAPVFGAGLPGPSPGSYCPRTPSSRVAAFAMPAKSRGAWFPPYGALGEDLRRSYLCAPTGDELCAESTLPLVLVARRARELPLLATFWRGSSSGADSTSTPTTRISPSFAAVKSSFTPPRGISLFSITVTKSTWSAPIIQKHL